MIQMWLFVCKSVNHFACCIWHCFNLALFLQDHGFDPPYRANHLSIVHFLYAYTETCTLEEIIWDTAELNNRRRTQHIEDQRGLVKLAQVTLYWTYRVWHLTFWHKKWFRFSSGQNEVFRTMLTGSPALSFSLLGPARRWSRLSPAHFFDRPHWPRAWKRWWCYVKMCYYFLLGMNCKKVSNLKKSDQIIFEIKY